MQSTYFGRREFAKYAPTADLIDAETIRTKILTAYELAEITDDDSERSRLMTFVLVGGGPTGVDLAASIAHLATVTLRGNFRRIDPAKRSVILIEGGNRILPSFAESLSKAATRRLESYGVKVLTGTKVEKVDEQGVLAGGRGFSSATGVMADWASLLAPMVKTLSVPKDRVGRLRSTSFLDGTRCRRAFRGG